MSWACAGSAEFPPGRIQSSRPRSVTSGCKSGAIPASGSVYWISIWKKTLVTRRGGRVEDDESHKQIGERRSGEVYTPRFFKANPTPSVYETYQTVNGVRPQVNCAVCNTGDIHINGLEGPYTMVLIDGMPIVSGLSTVYGLNGIPASLIEQVEVVKGPASTLYGSEAVGGLINIITKQTTNAPRIATDVFGTTWGR